MRPLQKPSGAAAICQDMAPYRLTAESLEFRLVERACDGCGLEMMRCLDSFLHPTGIWLELAADFRRPDAGEIRAEFRSWCRPEDGELVEVVSVASRKMRPGRTRAIVGAMNRAFGSADHPSRIDSAAALPSELYRHEEILRRLGASPLIAAGDPREDRRAWEAEVRRTLAYLAPP